MKDLQLSEEKKEYIIFIALQICLYVGAILLLFYIFEYGISRGAFPFFNWIVDVAAFGNMLAVFVSGTALVLYEHTTDKTLSVSYIVMIVTSTVAVAVFGNGAVFAFMLFIPLFVAAFVNPTVERMKRLLQIFFMEAFLFANMSLLFNYTDFMHTQGVTYSLESSVVGELVLAIFALIVMKEWDKLPQDEDISRIRLCTLRKKCRKALVLCGFVIAFALIIGWDMGVMSDDVAITFNKADGTVAEAGIFTNVLLKLFYGINRGFSAALKGNVIGLFAEISGIAGVIIIGIVLIYLCYILYRHLKYSDKDRDALDLVAVVGLLQFMVLPVCMEMVIFYCVCIFCCAVRGTGWKLNLFWKKKVEDTDLEEEVGADLAVEEGGASLMDEVETELAQEESGTDLRRLRRIWWKKRARLRRN